MAEDEMSQLFLGSWIVKVDQMKHNFHQFVETHFIHVSWRSDAGDARGTERNAAADTRLLDFRLQGMRMGTWNHG